MKTLERYVGHSFFEPGKKSVRSVDAGSVCASDGTFSLQMHLDHDREGCKVLVPGQRKAPSILS